MTNQTKKHTATPWKIESNVKHPNRLIYSCDESLKPYQRSIGIISESDEGKDGEANAEFIVKACNAHYELVEALREIYNMVKKGAIPNQDDPWWEQTKQALEKAGA